MGCIPHANSSACLVSILHASGENGLGIDLAICRNLCLFRRACHTSRDASWDAHRFLILRWTVQSGHFLRCSAGGGKISLAQRVVPNLAVQRANWIKDLCEPPFWLSWLAGICTVYE